MAIRERTVIAGIVGDSIGENDCVKMNIDIYDIIGEKRSRIETETHDFMNKIEQILKNEQ